jgi:hypothetical protein
MVLVHVLVGVVIIAPSLGFGFTHLSSACRRPNRGAVRLGLTLFVAGIVVV